MGSKTQTTKNKTTLPGYLEQTYKGLINAGTAAAKAPQQQYSGARTAGFTPMQQQAFQMTQNAQGMGIPYLNAASQSLANASQSVYPSLQQYNMGNLQQYMDPYQQSVIDATMANINKSNAVAQQGLKGSGMGMGVSPTLGDRMGLGQAELERNQGMARNQTIAGLESQGFQNAQNQFLGQQNLQANTMGSDYARQLQAGAGFAGLGQQAQDQTYQGIAQLLAQGGQQQQLGQTQLDQAYQTFQDQQNYPKSQIEWLANLAYGQPKGSTQTTQTPGPNILAQLAGLATTGLGIAKTVKRGGGVHMDTGGSVPSSGGSVPIAAPMLNQDDFSYAGPMGFGAVPTGPGAHMSPSIADAGMYINALPQMKRTWTMPGGKPWTNTMPPNILKMLNQIPHFSLAAKDLEANKKSLGGAAMVPGQHMASGGDPWKSPYFDASTFGEGDAPPTAPDYGTPAYSPDIGGAPTPAVAGAAPPPKRNWGMPLIYAGLGMMASNSPFALQAIGEGAGKGLAMASELDKNPVVDDSGPTIRVYYPSERRWEDTGIPSTGYAKLQLEQQLRTQSPVPLTPEEIQRYGVSSDVIKQKGNPFWKQTATGRDIDFPGGASGITIQNFDPNAAASGLNKALDEKVAPDLAATYKQGSTAASLKSDLEALQALADQAPEGVVPRWLASKYGEFSSVGTAYNAISKGLAPKMRVTGSGSTSDIEYQGMLDQLTTLAQDPNGRKIALAVMDRKATIDMAKAKVVSDYLASNRTNDLAGKMYQDLQNLDQQTSHLNDRIRGMISNITPTRSSESVKKRPISELGDHFRKTTQGMTPAQITQEKIKVHQQLDPAYGAAAVDQALGAQ